MIQFNIQFTTKSKIFIQTFIHSIWKKRFTVTSGLKHVLTAQMRALASTCYAIFHIVCPFHIVHLFFIFLFDNFSNFKAFVLHFIHFSYEWRIFFIHSTIHSILCGKIFIQKNIQFFPGSVIQIQNIIHSK